MISFCKVCLDECKCMQVLFLQLYIMAQRDIRATCLYKESEVHNLGLLAEYGHDAWQDDLANAQSGLDLIKEEYNKEMEVLQGIVNRRTTRDEATDKELLILEHDLMSYIRNNEQTLTQVKISESRAKKMYQALKEQGQSTSQLDLIADQLLT